MKKKSTNTARNASPFSTVGLIAPVARSLDVNRHTLTSAIKAGHVATEHLGCGTRVVVIESAKAWAASERKTGPKPQADKPTTPRKRAKR